MNYSTLSPAIPHGEELGEIKDCVQQVIMESSRLEGMVAPITARLIGDALRLMNSYHSNLIEGHKTSILEIEQALNKQFSGDEERKYAQELCAAHVETERELMNDIHNKTDSIEDIYTQDYLSKIHCTFYSKLPDHHQFTHAGHGFTTVQVAPGTLRDVNVTVNNNQQLGPSYEDLPNLLDQFFLMYGPGNYFGDERIIAAAAAHHKLTWLHPFRDGNGRVCRLHSGLILAALDINCSNLWSLSRGFSFNKAGYMINLNAADQAPAIEGEPMEFEFSNVHLTDWCLFFLETCLDQINFMTKLLQFEEVDSRIDQFVMMHAGGSNPTLDMEASRLIKAAFKQGEVQRGEVPSILNKQERSARRVTKSLVDQGILISRSSKAPLTLNLTSATLRNYFPALYDPAVVGSISQLN